MRLPQELVENVIDCLFDDRPTLETCSLVALTWLTRSRHHLFNAVCLNSKMVEQWCSAIQPGPAGVSYFVHTLTLRQTQGDRWLKTEFLDTITDHFSSFQRIEDLSIIWLDLGDFKPESLTRHFAHCGSSLRSLHLSYISADYSALMAFLQLFPNLDDLLIHTPELRDDNPPPYISRTDPPFHGLLDLLSFDSASSPFISHLAGLDLRFSSISAFDCNFSSGFPLNSLLETSSLSLRRLEFEYVTFSKCTDISLMRCGSLQDVIVGAFEEGQPLSLLFCILSTLSSHHITHITIDFQAMPDPHWPEWKAIDAHLLQMAERCGLEQGPQVLLRTRLGMSGDVVDGRQLLPKYWDIGSVELRLNYYNQRGG